MNTQDLFSQSFFNTTHETGEQLNLDFRKENSREARKQSLPKAGTDKERILRCLRSNPEIHAKHICQLIDIDYHAVQRRVSELVRAELIEVAGKKDGLTIYKAK